MPLPKRIELKITRRVRMETKDTIKLLSVHLSENDTIAVNKALEERFRAGEQESDKKWRQILRDSVALAKLAGAEGILKWGSRTCPHSGQYAPKRLCMRCWEAKRKELSTKIKVPTE